ncbi:hypothetical protein HRbin36_01674 [bacterium HR36]|nr:hypothetical protein HRbin36_01674 [bacterium HR36]
MIIPCLWYEGRASAAVRLYDSAFPDLEIEQVVTLPGTPSVEVELVYFRLSGQPLRAMSGNSMCRFNPSVSLMVRFDPQRDPQAAAQLDHAWQVLGEGGQVLMPLDTYPFSPRYGWVQDKFGLSWQLYLCPPDSEMRSRVMPMFVFCDGRAGLAEIAGSFWRSIFPQSQLGQLVRYGPESAPQREGTVMYSDFRLGDTWFAAIDSALTHGFTFNESFSLMVPCCDQEEIDRLWSALSAAPEAEVCGWCRDKFGVSWQIYPAEVDEVLRNADAERRQRLLAALMRMKKIDLACLRQAWQAR